MQLDHIVHFIDRHPQEVIDYLAAIKIKAVKGGRHENWGTYNSLLYLQSSYIEFLAIEHQTIAQQSNNPLIQQAVKDLPYEGIGQVCFRTENIEALKQTFIEKGFSTLPIFPGERMRADGQIIRWKMLFLDEQREVPFPFFIEWQQDDKTRFQELDALGMIDSQLINTEIKRIKYSVESPEAIADEWCRLFAAKKEETDVSIGDVLVEFKAYNHHDRKNRPYEISLHPSLKEKEEILLFGSSYQ